MDLFSLTFLLMFFPLELIRPNFLLFVDDLKIYRDTKSVEDCKALRADIDSVHQWCGENCMEPNIQKNKIISSTRDTNSVHFNYCVSDVLILSSDYKRSCCYVR
jgi:hypothetical protein